MQIPTSFKIGASKWYVAHEKLPRGVRGACYPQVLLIVRDSDDPYVFWHELTHAILHDMGEDWRNEKFVTGFSKRLTQAIHTAKFDGNR
jgi:hypothetical protein